MSPASRELRVLFFLLHAGYLRYFRPAIELLAVRGHTVHLAFSRFEKDPGDAQLAHDLAASHPNITIGEAPLRARSDGWRPLAALVRSLIDLGRYVHPRYAEAPALRARMARKLTEHVRRARAVDPLTAWLTLRLVRFIESHSSEGLSRRIVGTLNRIERAIPTSRRVDAFLRAVKADVVLVTPLIEFASSQVEYVKSARCAGIPCGVCVASWDNLTGKGLIRVVPDRVFVWNEIQVQEAIEMHGIPRERLVATGAAKFDEWFSRTARTTYAEFTARVGLAADRPYILYVCSSPFIAPDEVSFVRRWLEQIRASERPSLRDVGVLVRPHPQNAAQWRGIDMSNFGNATVWPSEGAQPDGGNARADFFDSLAWSAAVVGINTSVLLEAAIVGKSVLTPLAPEFAGTQRGTLHFHYLLRENGGFVRIGATLDEHLEELLAVLERDDEYAEQTRSFVVSFVRPQGLHQPAAPILADAIEDLATLVPARARRTPRDYTLRALLTIIALGASVVGALAASLRRHPSTPEVA